MKTSNRMMLLASVLTMAACSGNAIDSSQADDNAAADEAATTAVPVMRMKPITRGIISMGPTPFIKYDYDAIPAGSGADNSFADLAKLPGVMSGAVINVLWGDLEPSAGRFDFSSIDKALANLRTYNRSNPQKPVVGRLRIWPNAWAPTWVKKLGGAPIPVSNGANANELTVGRFWTAAYLAAWEDLLEAVAQRYDGEPLIADLSNTTTSVGTDEPFHVLNTADLASNGKDSLTNLKAAGYTDAQQLANLEASVGKMIDAGFHKTRIEFACATYHPMGGGHPDASVTNKIMTDARASYGTQVILGNHALDNPLDPNDAPIYPDQTALGGPISYQTKSPGRITESWNDVVNEARSLDANSLELWDIGAPTNSWFGYPRATLDRWDALLRESPLAKP